MKNKELGRWLSHFLKYITENRKRFFWRDSDIDNLEELKALIQQSGEKPEIDEKWIEEKERELFKAMHKTEQSRMSPTKTLWFIGDTERSKNLRKDFIRQLVAEGRKVKTIQVGEVLFGKEEHEKQMARVREAEIDDIIDVVLGHVECHHRVDHDEDGVHETRDYDIDSEMIVKEKLRKILG